MAIFHLEIDNLHSGGREGTNKFKRRKNLCGEIVVGILHITKILFLQNEITLTSC